MQPSDQELMVSIRNRDEEAFDQLVTRFGEMMRAHLVRMVRDEAAAGDLLQEALVRVWNNAAQWEGRGTLKGWLMRIATNQSLNYLQAKQRRREQPLEVPSDNPVYSEDGDDEKPFVPRWMIDPSADPDSDVEWAERSERLRETIAALPPEKRTVFYLAHQSDMDMEAIANMLGIPEGTVKSRLHYTMKNLMKTWNDMTTETEE